MQTLPEQYDNQDAPTNEKEVETIRVGRPKPTPEQDADLPEHVKTADDLKLETVYGDYVHNNSGSHVNGSTKDDLVWQGWWKSLAAHPSHVCAPTRGPVSKMHLRMMTETMNGIKERKWNAETDAVFEKVIRCWTAGVTKARDIKNCMLRRMESWKEGK